MKFSVTSKSFLRAKIVGLGLASLVVASLGVWGLLSPNVTAGIFASNNAVASANSEVETDEELAEVENDEVAAKAEAEDATPVTSTATTAAASTASASTASASASVASTAAPAASTASATSTATAASTASAASTATATTASTPVATGDAFIYENGRTELIENLSNLSTPAAKVGHYVGGTGAFYFGHNTGVFSGLAAMSAGTTFQIRLNGVTKTYRVAKVEVLAGNCTDADRNNPEVCEVNAGVYTYRSDNIAQRMYSFVKGYDQSGGTHYDVVLMTCEGARVQGGTTSRRMVYAYEI